MLGEQIGEETGKVMVRRVISVDGGTKVEVTVQSTGRLLGIETRNNVTYCAGIRPDGSLYGEAQGLVVGKGGEQASFKAAIADCSSLEELAHSRGLEAGLLATLAHHQASFKAAGVG